ncbi:MAG: DUF2062 domain-containing protein [Nitrospinota bacterium]|nr:DUF2062 domain-containing protein [Nitrospinota bacterium]
MSGKLTRISVKLHNLLEDSSGLAKSFLPQKHHVEGSFASRILGATLLRREYWSFKGEALAKGFAVGLFVAFTPTLGIQMLLACIAILFIPGNLPIALATCWLTNPITAVPVYMVEWRIGEMILGIFGHDSGEPPNIVEYESIMDFVTNIFKQGGTLWLGSIISSTIVALLGYCALMGIVYLERWLRKIKLDDFRQIRREERRRKKELSITEALHEYATVSQEKESNSPQE